jgi:hypothetical protein
LGAVRDLQSIALVLSLIDLGLSSAFLGVVDDHRAVAPPILACTVGLRLAERLVMALLDIMVGDGGGNDIH